jgi:hypothetical protein
MINVNSEVEGSVSALEMLVEGGFDGRNSEENVRSNLVTVTGLSSFDRIGADGSIRVNCTNMGNGLLLTRNGFVLTAYHVISRHIEEWKKIDLPTQENFPYWMNDVKETYSVIDQNGNVYALDPSFYAYLENEDIALIKAFTFGRAQPVKIRFVDEDLKEGDEIKLFGLNDRILHSQYGKVTNEMVDVVVNGTDIFRDSFMTDAYGIEGFSGGIITNMKGYVAGVTSYMEKEEGKVIGKIGGAKARHVKRLLREVINNLR